MRPVELFEGPDSLDLDKSFEKLWDESHRYLCRGGPLVEADLQIEGANSSANSSSR
jgi:hypothetical protein